MRLKQHVFTLTLATIFAIGITGNGYAQDWTRFRGPNGTGISSATTIPAQFTEKDYNWKVELLGEGHSSPVLWGKKIFLTSADEDKGKRYVLCLNAKNGKTLWTKTIDFKKYSHHEFNNAAASTPTVDAEQVYVTFSTPENVTIIAFDHNGNEKWQKSLGKLVTQHGGATSPIVVENILILTIDQEQDDATGVEGFIIGMNRKTGKTVWKSPRSINRSSPYSTPILYQPSGNSPEVIFSSTAQGITSLNPKTGEKNWELTKLFTTRCVGSPVITKGLIFATGGQGNGDRQAVAIKPGSKQNKIEPTLAYQLKRGPCYVPTPIALGDYIFAWGDGGIVTCLKAENGEQVWQERVGGNFFGSPICVNNKLYAISTKGELNILDASDKFKTPIKIDLGETSHSTPATADGVLYLRTQSHLISVGGKKP